MQITILVLISLQVLIGLIELFISLNKHFRQRVEEIVHIPQEDRE